MINTGRRYYANGTYVSGVGGGNSGWWSPQTNADYLKGKQCIVNYYNNQKAGPFNVNGVPTTVIIQIIFITLISGQIIFFRGAYNHHLKIET